MVITAKEIHALQSPFLERHFTADGSAFVTERFVAKNGQSLLNGSSSEGTVTINSRVYKLGGDGDALSFTGAELASLHDGAQELCLRFEAAGELPAGLRVEVVYTAPAIAPVLIKKLRVVNGSSLDLRIDGIEVEKVSPETDGDFSLILEDDYVRDAMTIGGRRVYSPWIENHHNYIDTMLKPLEGEVRFAYPVPLNIVLAPAGRFESFRVFEFVMPNIGGEKRGLAFRQATRSLFPWTRARYLCCKLAPARTIEDYYRGIETAAEAGFEAVNLHHGWIDGNLTSPIFTNYNDYELRPELFPNGWTDVRNLTDYAHRKGIKISFYTIYVNTWKGNGDQPAAYMDNDWELIWAEDDKSSRWGTTLDPATGWGPFVNAKIEEAICDGGFDAYHLDGPYYGDICVAEGRDYRPGGPNQPLAWASQVAFYERMKELMIQGEAAQGFQAMAHGVSRITTTGYNEGDFGKLSMYDQILANRRSAYGFTRLYRPEAATTSVPVMPWSSREDAPNMMPMEEHAEEYDAYMANVFGYGFEGKPFLRVAFEGPKSRKAISRWLKFWKDHEEFFKEGYLLHVREPDGKRIDAIVHVILGSEPRALVLAYNPLNQELSDVLDLSVMQEAGLLPDGWQTEAGQPVDLKAVGVTVPARNASWVELHRIQGA